MNDLSFVNVSMGGAPVGRLALTPEGLCAFEYDALYMRSGVSISPFALPLHPGLFVAKRRPFQGGFGVFADSLPDGWGNLILDRYLREKGIDPHKLTLLERLSLVGTTGRGALEYHPDKSVQADKEFPDFDHLAAEAQKILTTEYSGGSLDTLYRYGGSPGGARPKVFVTIDGRQWLVKFKATTDADDIGKIEYEYSLLAKECGITMPETQLFESRYFGVERFDRTPEGKVHTVSAAGLLGADYREPSLDYGGLLKLCQVLTRNMEEVYALFRVMVFNIVIANRDDHAKNFSFQLTDKQWHLSPAYDLLPGQGFNGFHTTTVGGKGEPGRSDIFRVGSEVGLSKKRIQESVEEITDKARRAGMLRHEIDPR